MRVEPSCKIMNLEFCLFTMKVLTLVFVIFFQNFLGLLQSTMKNGDLKRKLKNGDFKRTLKNGDLKRTLKNDDFKGH